MFKLAARLASLLVVAGLGFSGAAFAGPGADISTPAWTNHALRLYVGPGDRYEVRTVLRGGTRVHVDRCSVLWCRVHAGRQHGYVFLYSLSFGQGPNSLHWPAQERHPGVDIWTGADARNGWGSTWER